MHVIVTALATINGWKRDNTPFFVALAREALTVWLPICLGGVPADRDLHTPTLPFTFRAACNGIDRPLPGQSRQTRAPGGAGAGHRDVLSARNEV